jgi:hypothetical protein
MESNKLIASFILKARNKVEWFMFNYIQIQLQN